MWALTFKLSELQMLDCMLQHLPVSLVAFFCAECLSSFPACLVMAGKKFCLHAVVFKDQNTLKNGSINIHQ